MEMELEELNAHWRICVQRSRLRKFIYVRRQVYEQLQQLRIIACSRYSEISSVLVNQTSVSQTYLAYEITFQLGEKRFLLKRKQRSADEQMNSWELEELVISLALCPMETSVCRRFMQEIDWDRFF